MLVDYLKWHNAKDSNLFAFQKVKSHKSLELFWTKECVNCGTKYLHTHSDDFMRNVAKHNFLMYIYFYYYYLNMNY